MGGLWQRVGLDNAASGRDGRPHSFYGDGHYVHISKRSAGFARLAALAQNKAESRCMGDEPGT
jgi:hypothetical protein